MPVTVDRPMVMYSWSGRPFAVQKSTPDTKRAMSQWLGSESSPGFIAPGDYCMEHNNNLTLFTLVVAEGGEHCLPFAKFIIKSRRLLNLKVDKWKVNLKHIKICQWQAWICISLYLDIYISSKWLEIINSLDGVHKGKQKVHNSPEKMFKVKFHKNCVVFSPERFIATFRSFIQLTGLGCYSQLA